jgi:hypothetical protein
VTGGAPQGPHPPGEGTTPGAGSISIPGLTPGG